MSSPLSVAAAAAMIRQAQNRETDSAVLHVAASALMEEHRKVSKEAQQVADLLTHPNPNLPCEGASFS